MRTNISSLKQHLSENLLRVKNGETIIIMERKTPIAKIIPMKGAPAPKLTVRPPQSVFKDLKLTIKLNFDPASYVNTDREDKWFTT